MTQPTYGIRRTTRATALAVSLSLVAPLLAGCGCGSKDDTSGANLPPIDASRSGGTVAPPQQPKQGMSTGKKVAILAGAAALYYLYKRNQDKRDTASQNRQYYLSKNGRVYYREKNGQAVWVTPPKQPIEVPMDEVERYPQLREFKGYDNSTSGYGDLSHLYQGR